MLENRPPGKIELGVDCDVCVWIRQESVRWGGQDVEFEMSADSVFVYLVMHSNGFWFAKKGASVCYATVGRSNVKRL